MRNEMKRRETRRKKAQESGAAATARSFAIDARNARDAAEPQQAMDAAGEAYLRVSHAAQDLMRALFNGDADRAQRARDVLDEAKWQADDAFVNSRRAAGLLDDGTIH